MMTTAIGTRPSDLADLGGGVASYGESFSKACDVAQNAHAVVGRRAEPGAGIDASMEVNASLLAFVKGQYADLFTLDTIREVMAILAAKGMALERAMEREKDQKRHKVRRARDAKDGRRGNEQTIPTDVMPSNHFVLPAPPTPRSDANILGYAEGSSAPLGAGAPPSADGDVMMLSPAAAVAPPPTPATPLPRLAAFPSTASAAASTCQSVGVRLEHLRLRAESFATQSPSYAELPPPPAGAAALVVAPVGSPQRKKIAGGAFGMVWKLDTEDGPCVVKEALTAADLERLPPEQRRSAGEALEALRVEARMFHVVGHSCPNIIGFYGESQNGLVLEYADGGDLSSHLAKLKRHENRAFNVWEARELLLAMVTALSFLHQRGIIHRDVKLLNILIAKGVYKLADFGSSIQLLPDQDSIAVSASRAAFTPGWAPPEILPARVGEMAVFSAKSDLFSLGSLITVVMTGLPLVDGTMWQGYKLPGTPASAVSDRVWTGFETPAFPPLPEGASAVETQVFDDLGVIVRALRTVSVAERPDMAALLEMNAFKRVKFARAQAP